MKLIIQIPCFNEENWLPLTLRDLPRELEGIDEIEWLIVDDGSTDATVRAAREHGVDHVVQLYHNQGLSRAFMAGLDACLSLGADIIVNTDADNQYDARDIPKLIQPILDGRAEIVIGDRQVKATQHFSPLKKRLQQFGSFVVRRLSKTSVKDAPSGFRAIHRRAATQLNVFNDYSYTIETIIQAGQKNMAIISVPIRTNPDLRPSRLVKGMASYVTRMLLIMSRIFVTYSALRFFVTVGILVMLPGVLIGLRFLWRLMNESGSGNIQSLILAAVFLLSGFFVILSGLLADLISVNRKLLEELRTRALRLEHHVLGPSKVPLGVPNTSPLEGRQADRGLLHRAPKRPGLSGEPR